MQDQDLWFLPTRIRSGWDNLHRLQTCLPAPIQFPVKGGMSIDSRTAHVIDPPDNVLEHSLAQISGLECLLAAVARPTS